MSRGPSETIDALWLKLSAPLPLWRVLRMGVHLLGFDERAGARRLSRLRKGPLAKRLERMLAEAEVGSDALQRLSALAEINSRRADAGFRITAIANLTVPVAVIGGLGQLYPQDFRDVLAHLAAEGVLGWMLAFGLTGVTSTVGLAYIRAREAGDLRDLLAIEEALRLKRPPGLEDLPKSEH